MAFHLNSTWVRFCRGSPDQPSYALWADSIAASTSAAVQHGALREDLAGARVGHVHVLVGGRLAPLTVDAVLQGLYFCHGYLPCPFYRVLETIVTWFVASPA